MIFQEFINHLRDKILEFVVRSHVIRPRLTHVGRVVCSVHEIVIGNAAPARLNISRVHDILIGYEI